MTISLRTSRIYLKLLLCLVIFLFSGVLMAKVARAAAPSADSFGDDDCEWIADSKIVCGGGNSFYFDITSSMTAGKPVYRWVGSDFVPTPENLFITFSDNGDHYKVTSNITGADGPSSTGTMLNREKRQYRQWAPATEQSKFETIAPNDWHGKVNPNGTYNKDGSGLYYFFCGLEINEGASCIDGTTADLSIRNNVAKNETDAIKVWRDNLNSVISSEESCDSDGGSLSFIFCPLLRYTREAVGNLIGTNGSGSKRGYLLELLTVKPLSNDAGAGENAQNIYKIWQAFRNIALGLYTLVFLLIIFGNGLGFDNYQIKKALPKLAAGSLMTFASFFIVQTLVDLSNALGNALPAFIRSISADANINNFAIDLSGAGQTVGIIFLILFALAALVAVIVGIAGLITRQIIIYVLVMTAPLAFVAWVFPNTEKLFKKWWSNLIKVCMMFPIITGMIAFSLLFAKSLSGPDSSATLKLAATVAPLIALIMIPKTFKWGGDAFAAGAGFVAGYAAKGTDAIKKRGGGAIGSGADTVRERTAANLANRGNVRVAAMVGGHLPSRRGAHMARQQRGTLLNEESKMAESEFSTATQPQLAREMERVTADIISNPNSVRNQARYRAAHARAIQMRDRDTIETSRNRLIGSGNDRAINAANTAIGPNIGDLTGFAPDLGAIRRDPATGAFEQFDPSRLSLSELGSVHQSFTQSLANDPVRFSQIRGDVLDRLTDPRSRDQFNGQKVQQLGLALTNLQAQITAGTATPQMIATHGRLAAAITHDPASGQWRFI